MASSETKIKRRQLPQRAATALLHSLFAPKIERKPLPESGPRRVKDGRPTYDDYLTSEQGRQSWGLIELDLFHKTQAGVCVLWGIDSEEAALFLAHDLNTEREETSGDTKVIFAPIHIPPCTLRNRDGFGDKTIAIPKDFPLRTGNASIGDAILAVKEARNNTLFEKEKKFKKRLVKEILEARDFSKACAPRKQKQVEKVAKDVVDIVITSIRASIDRQDAVFKLPDIASTFDFLKSFWDARKPRWVDLMSPFWEETRKLKQCRRAFDQVVHQVQRAQDTLPEEMFQPCPMYTLGAPEDNLPLKPCTTDNGDGILDDYSYGPQSDDEDDNGKRKHKSRFIDDSVEVISDAEAQQEDDDVVPSSDGESVEDLMDMSDEEDDSE